MAQQNWDFERVLSEALRTGDFSKLSRTAGESLRTAVTDLTKKYAQSIKEDAAGFFGQDGKPGASAGGSAESAQQPPQPDSDSRSSSATRQAPVYPNSSSASRGSGGTGRNTPPRYSYRPQPSAAPQLQYAVSVMPPYYSRRTRDLFCGVLKLLGGTFLSLISAAVAITFAARLITQGILLSLMIPLVLWSGALVTGILMACSGRRQYGIAKRFKAYWDLVRIKGYCGVQALSAAVDKSKKFVTADVERMLAKGMFPQGRLDQEKTTLMLGDELYSQYQSAKESSEARKEREKELRQKAAGSEVLTAGLDAVRQIRQVNDDLPGEEISRKLTRLEKVTADIFAYVEKRPEKLPEIRRFMDYYLPTTLKLVHSYREFESQTETDSIRAAKAEILTTLDVVSDAFETLLDELCQDDVLDVSSDISVLKTLLAQQGLTGRDFKQRKDDAL